MKHKFFRVYKLKKLLILAIAFLFGALLVANPEEAVEACRNALSVCANTIIPSMFPFFVCSGLLISLGFARYISKYLNPVMQPLFHVPGSGALALITGILSGYPVGASAVADLRSRRLCTKEEGERMLAFCTNSGPLFVLGAVGTGMFHSQKIGLLLYIAHVLAALLTGLAFRFYRYSKPSAQEISIKQPPASETISSCICGSIKNSVISILSVCGFVVAFSVFISVMTNGLFQTPSILSAGVGGFFEVTRGCLDASALSVSLSQRLLLCSAMMGFAGMCVHFQIIGIISKTDLSLRPYFLGKLLCAALSVLILFVLLRFVPIDMQVFLQYYPDIRFVPTSFSQIAKLTLFYLGIGGISMLILYLVAFITSKFEKEEK